ncbi:MAG: OmpA family protein [Myxococcales bacterium]|nr:OmpA family protein [Myxococcales bacterium]
MNSRTNLSLFATAAASVLCLSCAGQTLLGKVAGTQTVLQEAIEDGSKAIHCAPKETAIAEANIKFAEEALAMGEYFRGKEHAEKAEIYTAIARKKTDPVRCRGVGPEVVVVGPDDRDYDGYADPKDKCPDEPEDLDSFEDDDGCPDPDNDGDGVLDAAEVDIDHENKRYTWRNDDKREDPNGPGGFIDCRNDPEDKDGFEDEDGCPEPDNDRDTIVDESDQCPNDPEDFDQFEDEDGCPDRDNDGDGVLDASKFTRNPDGTYEWTNDDGQMVDGVYQDCRNAPETFNGKTDQDGCPEVLIIRNCQIKLTDKVYFKFNKHEVDPKSFGLLDQVADTLNVASDLNINIDGHTDSKGSDKYNDKLSQRRVDSVKSYLVGKGIDPNRLFPTGYGERKPIADNKTSEGRAANRRVEFNIRDCKDTIQ